MEKSSRSTGAMHTKLTINVANSGVCREKTDIKTTYILCIEAEKASFFIALT